ncbi:TIGR04219 family outer membrane beta-barrel protein [Alkanindiges sp. WGS2144]|uniref:TIGR04219 family outer membrane beta-barrel protein n=1 Tax=Alkanindiges sp. WGS2144 TaxID=3366808 RepID=UPI00375317E0
MSTFNLKRGLPILAVAVLTMASMNANADFVGLYAGVDGMYTKADDSAGQSKDKFNAVYNLAFEHPVPFLPNVKLRYSDFSNTESDGNALYVVDQTVGVQTLDALGYYEILDNIVSVDAGLGVKRLNTKDAVRVSVANLAAVAKSKYDETMPALYVAAGGKMPFTGLSAKAEVMAGKSSDADFSDINAEVKYNFIENIALDLGVKFGYRAMTINFDDDAKTALREVKAKGPYLGLEAHF